MMKLKNLVIYIPKEDTEAHELSKMGAAFLKDENDLDWYESQSLFKTDTLKIAYSSDGAIRAASEDVSTLWPIDMSVVEIDKDNVPDGFIADGNWLFDGKKIVAIPVDLVVEAETKRKYLLDEANEFINQQQWPSKLMLGRLFEDEKKNFNRWLDYIDALNAVDTSKPSIIIWPEKPTE